MSPAQAVPTHTLQRMSLSICHDKDRQRRGDIDRVPKAFQEYDFIRWLDSNSRKCPNCQAKIQKALGCNKMTCTHCSSSFCWLCSAFLPRVNPYRHFQEGVSKRAGNLFKGFRRRGRLSLVLKKYIAATLCEKDDGLWF